MKILKKSFYSKSTGRVLKGTLATKAHEELLKRCGMDVDKYIGGEEEKTEAPAPKKKPAKKKDE